MLQPAQAIVSAPVACLLLRVRRRFRVASVSAGLTIGVFGDIGDTINSTMTLGHLAANSPQIILNVGDLVSAVLARQNGLSQAGNVLCELLVCSTDSYKPLQHAATLASKPIINR